MTARVRSVLVGVTLLGAAVAGCLTQTVNHCLEDPNQVGCPELCLEDPTLSHCAMVDPGRFVSDAGACGRCTVNRPYCDPATTTCVECTEANGCECWRDEPCGADTPVCTAGQCGACGGDEDCAGFGTAAICDDVSGACRGCGSDAECAAFAETPVCDEASQACVECTVDTEETACPPAPGEDVGPACDPTAFSCTGAIRGTLGFCQACVSDSECGSSADYGIYRCVPVDFQGAAHGSYCMLDLATHRAAIGDAGALCPDRQPAAVTLTSVAGVEAEYCVVDRNLATCEAVLDFRAGCTSDTDCGDPGLNDGMCRDSRCTYQCGGDADCAGGSAQPANDDVCNGIGVTTCNPN